MWHRRSAKRGAKLKQPVANRSSATCGSWALAAKMGTGCSGWPDARSSFVQTGQGGHTLACPRTTPSRSPGCCVAPSPCPPPRHQGPGRHMGTWASNPSGLGGGRNAYRPRPADPARILAAPRSGPHTQGRRASAAGTEGYRGAAPPRIPGAHRGPGAGPSTGKEKCLKWGG